ncbi:LOW QUALITY PROTEIN: focadhesin [Bombina bombina]|uniref:LOW QUALITY PROTEIN: focadhesin n=1 Tax=Bombina bombina TaxID=8345 RepID=UPI00235A4B28|nr:LOW QUALITY PROTEIN: focadhesin [Bombina bombina]
MSEDLKKRLEFPNSLIQTQAVAHLIASVLKENVTSEKIKQTSNQTPALNLLWEKCSSDDVVVRTTCCEALVALVEQNHADFNYVLNGILNLAPSARNIQGLVKCVWRLLYFQAHDDENSRTQDCKNPYTIWNPPHPFISMLENRPDCWPTFLQQFSSISWQCPQREKATSVCLMAPFLRYLYCEPSHLQEYAAFRISLRKTLLQVQSPKDGSKPPVQDEHLLCLFCEMVGYMQLTSLTEVAEATEFLKDLCESLQRHPDFWGNELHLLSLQVLCACEVSLKIAGDCFSLIQILESNVEYLKDRFPSEQALIGLSLLLLHTPPSQQKPILNLALKIISCTGDTKVPALAQVLVMPLLHVLSSSTLAGCEEDEGISREQLAMTLLEMVQNVENTVKGKLVSENLIFPITTWNCTVNTTLNILITLQADKNASHDWLSSVSSMLPFTKQASTHVLLLLSFLLIHESGQNLRKVLKVTTELAKADSFQVPYLFPVLLFKLEHPMEPQVSRDLLYTLPTLGTHKVCVPQILRALQMLGRTSKLQPICLRLMTSLWQKQDRVYPELQKLIALSDVFCVSTGKDTQWEKTVGKAATIRDICRQRPYQHGADMLAAITQVLNDCTKLDLATPAALVLQGLHALFQAEVVDIRSTWAALSPKLSCDTRPLVLKSLHEIFALVPSLTVSTEEYEKFKAQIIGILWSHTQIKDPIISSSAYKSLSSFGADEHNILHLPEQARPELIHPDESDIAEEEEEKEVDLSVPGSSYIKLLGLTPPSALPAFEEFLGSLVKQEMANMPRGIYHTALRGGAIRSDQGKTVAGIPSFMVKMYERNKQPGLKPGLAAGMLLCYDLPVQTDKDGRPINRFLASRGRSYQQMLTALIHEVNIQSSEWHRSILLPQSWLSFMSRTYHAVLQGRQAELEMQLKYGKDDPQELQYKTFIAWLWVRDVLTDIIRCAVKDSPVVKGNSLLALTGLAVAVSKYESSLPSEADGAPEIQPDILPTHAWISMVLDTVLSIVDSHYHPRGRVFPWFQHKSYSGENTSSVIARSCAATALSLLVPVLIVSFKEKMEEVLGILMARLPGKPAADDSQALQIHMGLAMGMFISRLYEEKVSDVSGQQMNLLMMKSLDALENCCFDSSLEYNMGCILGVGLVLSFMSQSSQTDCRVHVSATLRKLYGCLCESEEKSRTMQEVLAYSVACGTVSAFSAGIINAEEAEEHMNKLRTLTEQNQQTSGLALALGSIVHGLSVCGHGKAEDLNNRLLPAWIKILLAEGCPTMQRLSAVNGLVALVGSEICIYQLKSEAIQSSQFQNKLNEVIRSITQIINFSGVIGLQTNAAWILGHLYLSSLSSSQSRTSVPPDFGYLPEKSLIRVVVDFLISAGKKGPESLPPYLVKVCISSIAAAADEHQYPPVNWAAILAPLMRLNFGEEIQKLCVQIAVTQAQTSQNASVLLGMWVVPPLVYSLSVKTRTYLLTSLPLWIKHVSEDKLQTFADVFMVPQFETQNKTKYLELSRCVLQGVSQAMKLPSPPQHCWSFLCKTTENIFHLMPNEIQQADVELFVEIGKCLSEMADSEIERICNVSKGNIEKSTFVRVYLVSQGRLPLSCLTDVLTVAAECKENQPIVWMLLQAFYQARITSHQNTGVLKRLQWLLDLIGHLRNVIYLSTPVKNIEQSKAVDFLVLVFAACVVAWADHSIPLLLGVSANWLSWKDEEPYLGLQSKCLGKRSVDLVMVQECLTALPRSLQLLVGKEPWKENVQKFIDWLMNVLDGPEEALSGTSKTLFKASLLALRDLPEFKRKAIWTRAYGW